MLISSISAAKTLRALAISAPILCLSAGLAVAQSSTTAKSNPERAWAYGCQKTQDGKQLCRIVQNLNLNKDGKSQRLLTVIVQEQPKAKNHRLLLVLPHGLFLPAGVEVKVDENPGTKMAIQTSDARGAYAGTEISDALLANMKKGNKMNVYFISAARKKLSVPVTLKGFTAAYGQLKSQ